MQQFRGADVSKIEKVSHALEGKEFCVINGPASHSKQTLEEGIVGLGGMVVQNPDSNTLCVIAKQMNVRVKNLIKKDNYDIVKAEWLIAVLEASQWISW